SHRDRLFTASADAGKLLASGRFTRLVTHPRKFVVNGLTDTLMPVDFWRYHEESRLFPDPDKPSGPMRDGSGNLTGIVVKVTDRMGDGTEDLRRHVEHGDTTTRERLGIPAGACDLETRAAEVACAWVLSFLLVAVDRSVEVLSAGRHPVSLVEGRFAGRDYLARVCQGLHPSQFEPAAGGGDWRQRLTGWPADAQMRDGRRPGEVLVSVARPSEQLTLRWDNAEEDDADTRRLSSALASGLYWDIGHWHLLRLVPGDA